MKTIPKLNELIVYRKRREPALGILSSQSGVKFNIFSEDGKLQSVELKKIVLCTALIVPNDLTDNEKKLSFRNLRKSLEQNKDKIALESVWKKLQPDSIVDFEKLLEIYKTEKDVDNEERLSFFWAIDKNKTYFERAEDNKYLVNSSETVSEKIRMGLLKKEKENKREEALVWIKKVLSGETEKKHLQKHKEFIEIISNYAFELDSYENAKEAKSFIQDAGFKDVESVVEFLISIGFWEENEDHISKRFNSYLEYSQRSIVELNAILNSDYDFTGFKDRTDLEIYSVDDESTEDIDDAISFEEKENEFVLGVHISDVSFVVRREDFLDLEAQNKGESVYFVENTINMFPESLVRNKLSLLEGQQKPSLSVFVAFDKNDFNLKNYYFERTKIRLTKNITYEEATQLFNSQSWRPIIKLSETLRENRLKKGALIVQLPELKIKINGSGRITTRKNLMTSMPHRVISECMVLMNTLAADFFHKNNIPSIYRSQTQEIDNEARELDQDDPLYATRIVKHLKPSRVVLSPEPHKSLGIDSYVQITSPIRRYLDLVLQRQLTSYMSENKITYSTEELENLNSKVSLNVREIKNSQRSRHRYWFFKYLLQENIKTVKGYISQKNSYRTAAYIPQFFSELTVTNIAKKELKIGQEVELEIRKIDPLRRKIQLNIV